MYEAIFLLCHLIINAKVGPYIKFSVSSQKVSRGIGMGLKSRTSLEMDGTINFGSSLINF